MPTAHGAHVKYAWQHQADMFLNQAAPVQNTWYTVLAATEDVRILSMTGLVLVANETLEGRITNDGIVIQVAPAAFVLAVAQEAGNASPHDAFFSWSGGIGDWGARRAFFLEGQSVAIEIRKTTAAGAGNLQSRVKWQRLLPT